MNTEDVPNDVVDVEAEALCKALDSIEPGSRVLSWEYALIKSAITALRRNARDAERYRWLRDRWYIAGDAWPEELRDETGDEPFGASHFDDAIDAALSPAAQVTHE